MSSSFTRGPSPADSAAEKIVMGPRAQALTGPRLPLAFVVGCVVATLTVALVESAQAKRIVGTKGPDRIVGTAKADQVKSRRGKDRVNGRGGKDRLSGGPGADRLNALDGRRDRAVKGGPGNDFCRIDRADLAKMKAARRPRSARAVGRAPARTASARRSPDSRRTALPAACGTARVGTCRRCSATPSTRSRSPSTRRRTVWTATRSRSRSRRCATFRNRWDGGRAACGRRRDRDHQRRLPGCSTSRGSS